MIRWKALIRDVIIIFCLTGLGGFVVGLATAGSEVPMVVIGIFNIIFGIVGFTISGCMAKVQRFKHLFHVAVATWLLSVINVLLFAFEPVQWLMGIIPIMIVMVIGGGLSFLFVRNPE